MGYAARANSNSQARRAGELAPRTCPECGGSPNHPPASSACKRVRIQSTRTVMARRPTLPERSAAEGAALSMLAAEIHSRDELAAVLRQAKPGLRAELLRRLRPFLKFTVEDEGAARG
jgi:hypothetical protein